jgi:GntR family transcriptional regulator
MSASLGVVVGLTSTRAPIYVQLSTLFRRFIVTGVWPVGAQIPTHETLAAQFEVNPATIRKAIALLEDEDLVERFRRRGTFVTAKPASAEWFEIGPSWKGASEAYDGLQPALIESGDVASFVKFHAEGELARGYRFLSWLFRRNGKPTVLEHAYVAHKIRRKIGNAKLLRAPGLKLIAQTRGICISRAFETIRFGTADGHIAALLKIPLNAPLAILHQAALDQDKTLVFEARAYVRGDLVRISEPIEFD